MKPHTLETDTPLLPWLIADDVCREVESFLQVDLPETYRDQLDGKAEAVYAANRLKRFGKMMRRNNAPSQLRVFMRHWLASILKSERWAQYQKLPRGFSNGEPIQ